MRAGIRRLPVSAISTLSAGSCIVAAELPDEPIVHRNRAEANLMRTEVPLRCFTAPKRVTAP